MAVAVISHPWDADKSSLQPATLGRVRNLQSVFIPPKAREYQCAWFMWLGQTDAGFPQLVCLAEERCRERELRDMNSRCLVHSINKHIGTQFFV